MTLTAGQLEFGDKSIGAVLDTIEPGMPKSNPTICDCVGPSQQLSIVNEVAGAIASSLDLDRILQIILTGATASQGLGFNRAFLFMYESESSLLQGHLAVGPSSAEEAGEIWNRLESAPQTLAELLEERAASGRHSADRVTRLVRGLSLKLNEGSIIGEACRRESWVNLEQAGELDETSRHLADSLGTSALALVPLVNKGNLLGLLVADNSITSEPVTNHAVQLLQILANQAAIAMEQARLYDEQREQTRQLMETNRLLAESQDQIVKIEKMMVIGELTEAVAHELRNPLTIIGGFANLMLKQSVADEQKEYLSIIASETRRSENVLHQLLDFSKASKTAVSRFDLSGLVKRNIAILAGRRNGVGTKIDIEESNRPTPILGNADQISHAVYQFINTAVEELIPGCRLKVRISAEGKIAVVSFSFEAPADQREGLIHRVRQTFGEHKRSAHLPLLVAGETIRYHNGSCGVRQDGDNMGQVFIALPLNEDTDNG